MTDYAALYRESRERITALVRTASDEQRARIVPGCPKWSVTDTVAHLAAVAVETVRGLLTEVPTDEQTAAQVAQRRGLPLDELFTEWKQAGEAVEQALTAICTNFRYSVPPRQISASRIPPKWALPTQTPHSCAGSYPDSYPDTEIHLGP